MNFITYLESPYVLDYNYTVVPLPTGFFVSAYLNGEGVQEFLTHGPTHNSHKVISKWNTFGARMSHGQHGHTRLTMA
jgi:hypothetical protein